MAKTRSVSASESKDENKNNVVTPIRVRMSEHKILDSACRGKKKWVRNLFIVFICLLLYRIK